MHLARWHHWSWAVERALLPRPFVPWGPGQVPCHLWASVPSVSCVTEWETIEEQRLKCLARANMLYGRVSQCGHYCYSGPAHSGLCWAVLSTAGCCIASLALVPWTPEAIPPNPYSPSLYNQKGFHTLPNVPGAGAKLPPLRTTALWGSISCSGNYNSHHLNSLTGLVFTEIKIYMTASLTA